MIQIKARYSGGMSLECEICLTDLCDLHHGFTLRRENFRPEITNLPLLSIAGFYERPFRPIAEETIEIVVKANDELVRGRVDILVLNEQIWVATIESKGPQFSWHVGLPQALTYMFSGSQPSPIHFGLVTNGTDLVFVKLHKDTGQYGLSKTFSIFNPGNELHSVVAVLKTLSTL